MKQIYLKLSMLLACMLIGLGSAWGETYTIDFNKGTTNGTSINGDFPSISTLCNRGADNISTINTSTNCYYKASGCGVRLGKSGGAGTFKITLSETIQEAAISKVVVYASKVSGNTVSKLTVTPSGTVTSATVYYNSTLSAYSTSSSESTNYELSEISINGTLNTLQFEAPSGGYVMLHRIDIVTSSSTTPAVALSNENLDFGTVEQNSEVSAKTITAIITNVSSATVALSGEGASAFSLDKTSLTESGSITITPNTTAVGTYEATLTLSAEGATSVTRTVKMTVSEPKVYYAVVSKYNDKYYAMSSTLEKGHLNAVEVTVYDGCVINATDEDVISWILNADGTISNKAGKFVTCSTLNTDVSLTNKSTSNFTETKDDNGNYWKDGERALIYVSDGWFKNYAVSNAGKNGYGTIGYLMPFKKMPTATVTLNAACNDGEKVYGTYSNTSAFVVPADLTVSAVAVEGGKLVVSNYVTGEVVHANTGVMVSAEKWDSGTKDFNVPLTTGAGVEKTNNLKPSSEAMTGDYMFYRLTMHNGTQIGYWWGAENGGAFNLGANKAYLAVPKSASVKAQGVWFDDDATSISAPAIENNANETIYNLNGQRVNTVTKGMYIMNGKKYFVK